MARLRRDEIRSKVKAYFQEQLRQYQDRLDRYGLSKNALEDARCEMLDHDCMVENEGLNEKHLPIARFRRKAGVSEVDWSDSLPQISVELRKGRRDMLNRVLEAAEALDHYSFTQTADSPETPSQPASAPLGRAIEDYMTEHSREWPQKTQKQFQAYLNILLEYFGPDRPLVSISKQDASEVKKILLALPASRNTKPALKDLPLKEVVKVTGHKRISPKTINSHIDRFHNFFKWAANHGHTTHVLFADMKVAKAKAGATDRAAFTPEQIQKLFTELTDNSSKLVKKESHKWATLLACLAPNFRSTNLGFL